MPRIAGIDVPDKKKIYFALQYIHGIGPEIARRILDEAKRLYAPAAYRDLYLSVLTECLRDAQ